MDDGITKRVLQSLYGAQKLMETWWNIIPTFYVRKGLSETLIWGQFLFFLKLVKISPKIMGNYWEKYG